MTESHFNIDRVKEAMRARGVTQTELSKAIGLTSQSAMSNILHGKRGVSVQEAQGISEYLGLEQRVTVSIQIVPIIGLTSAGNWREAIAMPISEMALPSKIVGKRSFALEVSGDSMNLLIEDGGFVVVDPDKKELLAGKCYLIQNGEHESTVKRYMKDPPRLAPVSDNPEHREFLMSDCDFIIIGRVVWKGAPL